MRLLWLPAFLLACEAETLPLPSGPLEPERMQPPEGPCLDCADIEGALNGLRWSLPCGNHVSSEVCETLPQTTALATMRGEPGAIYEVELRFRGVVELTRYLDGIPIAGRFVQGGARAPDDPWNTYALHISDPPSAYFLNSGESGLYHCVGIDYQVPIQIAAGATATLLAESHDDRQITNFGENGVPIVVPGLLPYPDHYDGQFIHMLVQSVVKTKP